jgi:hypothetical protein
MAAALGARAAATDRDRLDCMPPQSVHARRRRGCRKPPQHRYGGECEMTGNLPGAGGTGEPQRRNVPSSAVPAGRPAGEHALGVLDAGGGDVPLPRERGGSCEPADGPDDLVPGGIPAALLAARAGTGKPGSAGIWAVRPYQGRRLGRLSRPAGAQASGNASGAGLADVLPGAR